MSTNKIVAKRISVLAEEIQADSDYVYDPKHLNRPYGGGTWYKTEKGWSTHKPLKDPHKKVKEVQKEDSNKPLDFTDKQYQDDYGYTPEQRELASKAISSNVQDRTDVARNKNTPIDILSYLSQDNEWIVRASVARNRGTHPGTLDNLSNDDDWMVKWSVAENPNTEANTLDRMAKTGDSDIKKTVAQNTSTSISTLDFLGESDDHDIVQDVVYNPKTSNDTLNKIKSRDSFWEGPINAILEKRKTSSSELKQQADEGDDISKEWLEKRKKLRHDFCTGQLGDEETYQQVKNYKKSIGEKKGFGRSPQQVKDDFVRNMDPSKYGSSEEFQAAKKRIQEMPVGKFDKLLGIIFNKDEDEDEEVEEKK